MTIDPDQDDRPSQNVPGLPPYLVVVAPGPVLSVYRGGQPVASIALTATAALSLIADLAREVRL